MTLNRVFDRRELKGKRRRKSTEPQPSLPGMVTDPTVATVLQLKAAAKKAQRKSKEFHELFAFQVRSYKLPRPFQYIDSKGKLSYEFRYCNDIEVLAVEDRQFRADFAWPEFKLLIEIHGGIWQQGGGGHSRPAGILRDITKHQYAALLGYFVLPVTTDQVTSGHAIAWTQRVLTARGWTR